MYHQCDYITIAMLSFIALLLSVLFSIAFIVVYTYITFSAFAEAKDCLFKISRKKSLRHNIKNIFLFIIYAILGTLFLLALPLSVFYLTLQPIY